MSSSQLLQSGKQPGEPSSNRPGNPFSSGGTFANTCEILSKRVENFLKKNPWFFPLFLIAVTLIAYAPAWHGQPVWDDDKHLVQPELLTGSGLASIWFQPRTTQQYHPLVDSFFWAGGRLWGTDTLGFHILNILLHAGSAFLLYRILRKLDIPGAMLAAAIFALHPVEVESVAWMAELKNTLSGFFFFACMLAWLKFERTKKHGDYAVLLALFILGFFAKTIVATLPLAILIVLWWKNGKLKWDRSTQYLVPLVVLGAIAGAITGWMEQKFSGAEGAKFDFSFIERCFIAGHAFWLYLGKLLLPVNLMFVYPRWPIHAGGASLYLYPLAALLLMAGLVLTWRRLGLRAPLAAMLFFVALVFPLIGFFNVYFFAFSFVADHFQYLPSVGIITLVSAGIALGINHCKGIARVAGQAACIVMLLVLGVLTWRESGIFKDARTIFLVTLDRNPDCWMACTNLGNIVLQEHKLDEALEYYRRSVKINPDNPKAMDNLGVVYLQKGRVVEAVDCFKKAIALRYRDAEAHNNLGNAYLRQKKVREAVASYQQALKINPNYAEAHENLSQVYFAVGKINMGIGELKKAEIAKPKNVGIHNNLSLALLQNGQVDEALAEAEKAFALAPTDGEVCNTMGICLLKKGRTPEAISYFEKAMATRSLAINTKAANNLAWVLSTSPDAKVRNGPKAVSMALQLNRLAGGKSPLALCTLAAAYAESGRYTEAVTASHQALKLSGTNENNVFVASLKNQIQKYELGSPYRENPLVAR